MKALSRIHLAFHCPADWEAMEGDDRQRFCGHCRMHVHNLSAMTREEAEVLMASAEKPCVRFQRRADGTTVFAGCPRKEAGRRKLSRVAAAGLAAAGSVALASCQKEPPPVMGEIGPPPAPEHAEVGQPAEALLGTPIFEETD